MRAANRVSPNGFSLVETMVAVTIGLITALVIGQVLLVASARKQTSVSGADSTTNGTLALYTIERDAKNAGYGMTSIKGAVGCPIEAKHDGVEVEFNLVPAVIGDGADGGPDSVQLLASAKNGIALPTRISMEHPRTAANFFVESTMGVAPGDMMIAVPSQLSTASPPTTWCALFQVTNVGGANGGGGGNGGGGNGGGNGGGGQGQNQVLHNSGLSEWNQPGGNGSVIPPDGYGPGDHLINLGRFADHTYSIVNGQLRLRDYNLVDNAEVLRDLYPNVVQLQAVYGKDTSGTPDNIVDVWNATAPTTPAEWQQIIALRVALVARGAAPQSTNVTLDGAAEASTCNSATPHPAAVCWKPDPNGNGVKIDVSAVTNWQRYRYRVFESTIPLRNAIWKQ